MQKAPFVTVIMPIRNEAAHIARSLSAVLAQDYPHDRMEVLVVDGMSDDGTRGIVQRLISGSRCSNVETFPIASLGIGEGSDSLRLEQANFRAVLLDNPGRIVPTALNIGLRHARGDVIIRVDGHCEIPPDYVRRCIEALRASGAACAGGQIVTIGDTRVARGIALAQSSRFGVGGVAFRTEQNRPGYVDTLAFGAYRWEVFERIGGFDEELVRNQDDEFNFRLIQAGGKIWLDPSIRSIYYSRATLRRLWRQYFQYGLYKVRVIQKRGAVPSWRHLVPALFVLGMVATPLLAFITGQPVWALAVAGPYAIANLAASLWTARKDWSTLPLLPPAFLILHLAYGLGFLAGLWRWRAFWGLGIGGWRPVTDQRRNLSTKPVLRAQSQILDSRPRVSDD